MIEFVLLILAFLTARNRIGLFLIKKRLKETVPIKKGNEPFYWRGKGNKAKTGILLIHGFTSSPGELKDIGKKLHKKGYTVHAPLLPGHGTTPGMLAITKYQAWITECEKSIELLQGECKKIFLVGNSMGANLALITAKETKKIAGITCISIPLVPNRKMTFFKAILPLMKQIKLFQRKKYSKKFRERVGTERKESYNTIPVRSLSELYKTIKASKKAIPHIQTPLLVIQSHEDEVTGSLGTNMLVKQTKTKNTKVIWVRDSMHSIILDPQNKETVQKEIEHFIEHQ